MKKVLLVLAVFAGIQAKADGFLCQTESGLNVKAFNSTDANVGTRTGSHLIISDSAVGSGNKTIATFSAEKKTLSSSRLSYVAKVDLRVSESNRKGENIGGTKLGQLASITLDVDFSYAAPLQAGEEMQASLTLLKRNGEEIVEEAICTRYLKN